MIEEHVRPVLGGGIAAGELRHALRALPSEKILAFDRRCLDYFRRSRTWSLWGAAGLIHDGAPDDTFDYFRSWLIGRGRAVFEAALRDPDSLDGVATAESLDDVLYAAAGEAYRAVTGVEIAWDGEDWPELRKDFDLSDRAELKRRYPRLFARFTQEP